MSRSSDRASTAACGAAGSPSAARSGRGEANRSRGRESRQDRSGRRCGMGRLAGMDRDGVVPGDGRQERTAHHRGFSEHRGRLRPGQAENGHLRGADRVGVATGSGRGMVGLRTGADGQRERKAAEGGRWRRAEERRPADGKGGNGWRMAPEGRGRRMADGPLPSGQGRRSHAAARISKRADRPEGRSALFMLSHSAPQALWPGAEQGACRPGIIIPTRWCSGAWRRHRRPRG